MQTKTNTWGRNRDYTPRRNKGTTLDLGFVRMNDTTFLKGSSSGGGDSLVRRLSFHCRSNYFWVFSQIFLSITPHNLSITRSFWICDYSVPFIFHWITLREPSKMKGIFSFSFSFSWSDNSVLLISLLPITKKY